MYMYIFLLMYNNGNISMKNNDFRINVGGTTPMRLQWPVLLSEMSLEYSHGDTCQSDPELGYGATSSIPRCGTASNVIGGSFCIATRRAESEVVYFSSGFVAGEGE